MHLFDEFLMKKWGTMGTLAGFNLTDPKARGDELRKRLEDLNQSPKDTHIEIQNICISEGLEHPLPAKLGLDCALFKDSCEAIRNRFSEACTEEVIRRIYEKRAI